MVNSASVRTYGRRAKKPRAQAIFAELPTTSTKETPLPDDLISSLTEKLTAISLQDPDPPVADGALNATGTAVEIKKTAGKNQVKQGSQVQPQQQKIQSNLRVLSWADICPLGDQIEKIAEASYAEVYRIRNDRGTSIIKVIRLESPIRPQTKAQIRSGLVDEEPHCENDLLGELRISEWLADIPGFVVYKERYIVQGKTTPALLDTHQIFHRKMKRKDPDRLQFYPSPSRYLEDTKFLVVELGDAGTALEDFDLMSVDQIWDIFLHVAIALARAEDQISFEHRDLHEGNLCIRQTTSSKRNKARNSPCQFGSSGIDITILDYGLSRGQNPDKDSEPPVAFDLEKDLGLFKSTHAPQCKVYRQMRSFLMKGDRAHLPPKFHNKPYDLGVDGPISWDTYNPYTNVLWLAYLYEYLTKHFQGLKADLVNFMQVTQELWSHLDPSAPREILSFSSAVDVIKFAVEAGWVTEEQLMGEQGEKSSILFAEDESHNISIVEVRNTETEEAHLRRSPRRHRPRQA